MSTENDAPRDGANLSPKGLDLPPRAELAAILLQLVSGKDASRDEPVPVPFLVLTGTDVHPIAVFGKSRHRTEYTPPCTLFPFGTSNCVYVGHWWDIDRALDEIDRVRVDARWLPFAPFVP